MTGSVMIARIETEIGRIATEKMIAVVEVKTLVSSKYRPSRRPRS